MKSQSASGGAYVTDLDKPGDHIDVTVTVATAGTYPLRIWYRTLTSDRISQVLTIDGRSPMTINYPSGGNPSAFPAERSAVASVTLTAGSHVLRLEAQHGEVDLDRMTIDSTQTTAGLAYAATAGANKLEVVTMSGDRIATRSRLHPTSAWSPWATGPTAVPDGGPAGPPAAISSANGTLEVEVLTGAGQLVRATRTGAQWSPWQTLGAPPQGAATAGSAVASRGTPNRDVYVLGADGRVWSTATSDGGANWMPWGCDLFSGIDQLGR